MQAYLRLMRPGDWTKNVFVLPALVFSVPQWLRDPSTSSDQVVSAIAATCAAFFAFCLISSGFYAINDARDAGSDRAHPVKRTRPVASGRITPQAATTFGVICTVAALALGFVINAETGVVLASYAALQIAYNIRLKRVLFVDTIAVAIGFALRAACGAVAIDVQVSVWLVLCVFFLCLFLGFVKRLCDMAAAERAGAADWHSPAGYESRAELHWLLGISAVLAVMTFLMYSLSEHTWSIFGVRALGFALLTPFVLIALFRFFRRADAGLSVSPLEAVLHDRAILAAVVLFSAGVFATLYAPRVDELLEAVFLIPFGEGDAR